MESFGPHSSNASSPSKKMSIKLTSCWWNINVFSPRFRTRVITLAMTHLSIQIPVHNRCQIDHLCAWYSAVCGPNKVPLSCVLGVKVASQRQISLRVGIQFRHYILKLQSTEYRRVSLEQVRLHCPSQISHRFLDVLKSKRTHSPGFK